MWDHGYYVVFSFTNKNQEYTPNRCSNLIFNPLKIKKNLNYVKRFNSYRAVNTFRLGYKTSQLMLYREIIAVCSEIHTKHINTLSGQNVEFVNVKPGGTYSNHWALGVYIKIQFVPRSKHTPFRL
jgi:hypothetical protein